MGMWGVEEDDTKGKARLPSTPTIEGAWFPKNCSSISMSEFVEIAGLGQSLSGLSKLSQEHVLLDGRIIQVYESVCLCPFVPGCSPRSNTMGGLYTYS